MALSTLVICEAIEKAKKDLGGFAAVLQVLHNSGYTGAITVHFLTGTVQFIEVGRAVRVDLVDRIAKTA